LQSGLGWGKEVFQDQRPHILDEHVHGKENERETGGGFFIDPTKTLTPAFDSTPSP
jgi:hypothetical protein